MNNIIIESLMTVVGLSMAFAPIPQIVRLYKRGTSDDISIWNAIIIILGNTCYFIYGIHKVLPNIIIASIISVAIETFMGYLILTKRHNSGELN